MSQDNTSIDAPVIVFGDGSAAVFLVSQLVRNGTSVIWAGGSEARLLPVVPYVKSELALGTLLAGQKLLSDEIFAHPVEKGTFHRVFRNKAFKMPSWKRTPSVEAQTEAFEDMVWGPEKAFLGVKEYRIAGLSPAHVEENLRNMLENHALVTRIEKLPLLEVEVLDQGGRVQFGNGPAKKVQSYEFSRFYYCDSIADLKAMPKLATIFKHQLGNVKLSSSMSALQVVFHHAEPLNQNFDTGLVIPMNRDAGENFDRDVIGYFYQTPGSNDSVQHCSVWTVFMQATETEENHEIMKKLRKMKQALNKAFDSPEFLPEGKKDFMSTVEKELVRFEQGIVLTEGAFKDAKAKSDFILVSDAFGLSPALDKVAQLFSIEPVEFTGEITVADADVTEEMPEMPSHLRNGEIPVDQDML